MRTITPKVYPITTRAPAAHFLTSAKKEMKAHKYTKPEIDSIPYP